MTEYVNVKVQGAVIDAVVLAITGPNPDNMDDPSDMVEIPFLRIEDALKIPRWYMGVGERDLRSVVEDKQVAKLEKTYEQWWRERNSS